MHVYHDLRWFWSWNRTGFGPDWRGFGDGSIGAEKTDLELEEAMPHKSRLCPIGFP